MSRENLSKLDSLLRELEGKVEVDGRLQERERNAKDVDLGGLTVRVCSLEHLLAMKRASDRARDRDDLEALEAVQEPGQNRG